MRGPLLTYGPPFPQSPFGNFGVVRIGGGRSGEKGPGFAFPTRGGSQPGCAGFSP